jgi:squalene-associated FAD-dependent desaturase
VAGVENLGIRLKIAVIGAGWAGLSAAVELAAQGIPVTVFEAAPNLGGRARGFNHNGIQLDNGQHILLGAYRETLHLMHQVGVDVDRALLRLPLRLETPGHLKLATPRLPAPLHLLAGLLTASGLNWSERLAAIEFMTRQRLTGFKLNQDRTVAEHLTGQPENLVRLLWEPLCLAALNTPIGIASAQVFLNVLRDSFSRTRADSDLLLPRTDLSTLFPQAAARYIERKGGQVRLSTTITSIKTQPDGVTLNGELFSHVVCAGAPYTLSQLLGQMPEMSELLATIGRFTWQPIATVYLQYPEQTVLPFPMIGLYASHAQWVFDRGTLCGQQGLLAAVISAEGPHLQLGHEQLVSAIQGELQTLLGDLPPPRWQQVIIEKRATFACTVGLQRPPNTTASPRIFLAGDYTASDYPATLEGAVRSGVQCAQFLISST